MRIPTKVSTKNPTSALSFTTFSALSIFQAPMFCPTSVLVAIASPSAGIITKLRTLVPIQYAATVNVPKDTTSAVIMVSHKALIDCSIEEGAPIANILLVRGMSNFIDLKFICIP